MTLQLVLAAHSRMTLLLHRAWRLRHLIDDFEDFLELSQYSYSVQLFSRCRALLDAWLMWSTSTLKSLHRTILHTVRDLD